MKIERMHQVGYMDVNPSFRMSLGALFRWFQEAAVEHSERVGIGSVDLVNGGAVWVLNTLVAEIQRFPTYREPIRVVTWHRGSRGFRAFRDFSVYAGDTRCAVASSMWLFVDRNSQRLKKIAPELSEAYTTETDRVDTIDPATWKPEKFDGADIETPITTRFSDFDPLGHVNNTVYVDMVETLAAAAFGDDAAIRSFRIQFQKEIGREVATVTAGLRQRPDGAAFRLHNGDKTFAAGELILSPEAL